MDIKFRMEEMLNEADTVSSLILAIYEAIYNGSVHYEKFEWAFLAVSSMAQDHVAHMRRLTDEAFMLLQKESA